MTAVANEPGGGTSTSIFAYALGAGSNFLTILAINGETLASVTIDAPDGFTALRQPRISGVALQVSQPVSLALLGLGMAGIVGHRWTRALGARGRRFIARVARTGEPR